MYLAYYRNATGDECVYVEAGAATVAGPVDTFRPLELGEVGTASDDGAYAWSWAGRRLDA